MWDFVDAITKKKAIANAPANQALLCKSKVSQDIKERLGNQRKKKVNLRVQLEEDSLLMWFENLSSETQHNNNIMWQ